MNDVWFKAQYDRIYRLCCRVVGDPHAAEDAAQNAFTRAIRFCDRFEGRSALDTWLYRIALRCALDERRRLARTRRREPVDAEALESVVSDVACDERMVQMRIHAAVDALPQSLRLPLIMHAIEGYAHEEVAAVLEISVLASRSRVKRARDILREALAPCREGANDE